MSHLDIAARPLTPLKSEEFISDVLNDDAEQYRVRLFHNGKWPGEKGQDVLTVFVDETFDDGKNWRHESTCVIGGGEWHTKDGKPANSMYILTDVSHPGVRTRKIRVTLMAHIPCSVGIRLFSE